MAAQNQADEAAEEEITRNTNQSKQTTQSSSQRDATGMYYHNGRIKCDIQYLLFGTHPDTRRR